MDYSKSRICGEIRNHNVLIGSCHIVKNITFSITAGETLVIMGPNGSGKSTLLNSMAGTHATGLTIENEAFEIQGKDVNSLDLFERSNLFSIVPQFPEWQSGLSVEKYFYFSRFNHLRAMGGEDLELLEEIITELKIKNLMKRKMNELSGGELKRISIAAALYQNVPVVFLDEPFQALDPQVKDSLAKFLISWQKNKGTTFIMASHDFYWSYKLASKVVFLKKGETLFQGDLADTFTSENLKSVYDINFEWVNTANNDGFFHPVGSL